MDIPKNIGQQDVLNAIRHIEENGGVPKRNRSTKYELVADGGKRYPPKYVIAVANHVVNGVDISVDELDAVRVRKYLAKLGFHMQTKTNQKAYKLTITSDSLDSTEGPFTEEKIPEGNNYKLMDAYFKSANKPEELIRYNGPEPQGNSGGFFIRTMTRLVCQIFEKEISQLSEEEKRNFRVCRRKNKDYPGIYSSEDEARKALGFTGTSGFFSSYKCADGKNEIYVYCDYAFDPVIFAQECLRRFGNVGDQFVLEYQEKEGTDPFDETVKFYSERLIESKNMIFRGAPGTGKTYLAKQIAAYIVSDGNVDDYQKLTNEQRQQVGFVQFHRSYDYTDFVEGLRPMFKDDHSMGFELHDGVFKEFVSRARKDLEDSQKTLKEIERQVPVSQMIDDFLNEYDFNDRNDSAALKTVTGHKFFIAGGEKARIKVYVPNNAVDTLFVSKDNIKKMLESEETFTKVNEIKDFFGKKNGRQDFSYMLPIYHAILEKKRPEPKPTTVPVESKKYVFIH